MGNFFAELKRRHVYRVGAAYAVVAWVLLQIVNNVAPVLDLPPWVARAFLMFLVLGFPITLLLAWVFEITPEGLKRTTPSAPGTALRAKTSAVDWILACALIALTAFIAYGQRETGIATPSQQQAGVTATSTTQLRGISIAVLPFANLSDDRQQEFFSDGMTDEIAGALAKVPDLRVIARSSAFQFKGQSPDVRMVGQALGASHLIEGSVRQAGERTRITAQLIRANDGVQLWSENYDRDLKDIFSTQEDIAQAIAGALRVPLGLQQGEHLVPNRTGDLESYDQYLRARALLRARDLDRAVTALEAAVKRDPNFAPSWALLARAYGLAAAYDQVALNGLSLDEQTRIGLANWDKQNRAAREAIKLDPKYPLGYVSLASVRSNVRMFAEAEDLFQRALALDPNDPELLDSYSQRLAGLGRLKDALRYAQQLRAQEPFVPIYNILAADIMELNGQYPAAITILEALPEGGLVGERRNVTLAHAYAATGRYKDAANTLFAIPIEQKRETRQSIENAVNVLNRLPLKVSNPESLPTFNDELNFVYAFAGATSRILDFNEILSRRNGSTGYTQMLWFPEYSSMRNTERFKALMRTLGLVDYWRARGWPDLCHPTTGDDFECD